MSRANLNRRSFMEQALGAAAAGTAVLPTPTQADAPAEGPIRKIKIGIIGCGSVSNVYLPHLAKCPYAELVSACDIIPARAKRLAAAFHISNHYPHIDTMLAGASFDLLVNRTDMQAHEKLNRQALEAGKHVWSEKPMANSLTAGKELLELAKRKKVRFWGAPTVVNSPQFAFMARKIAAGSLGRLAAAHADYGHTGPDWSSFFYEKGGGSLPDLGVYNLTTLTGLLGPARAVIAMTSIITPTRRIRGKGTIRVAAEDNSMVVLDHGEGVLSHMQSGFNYFNPHGHKGSHEERHTITLYGTKGSMGLVGYDWEPRGVDLATEKEPVFKRYATDKGSYVWEQGASLAAECLATGKELLITPEHALHIVEIIGAARQSQETGLRLLLHSAFKWPVVS
jgi:predicted dehydrogenase